MSNSNHYDVVIIGTGAGGGTLAPAGPTGQKDPFLERGDFVPREKATGIRRCEPAREVQTKEHWKDAEARSFIRTPTTMSAATPSSLEQLFSVCAGKTSARFAITADFARLADLLRGSRALLREGRASYSTSTASAAKTRQNRPQVVLPAFPASATSRACSNWPMISPSRV